MSRSSSVRRFSLYLSTVCAVVVLVCGFPSPSLTEDNPLNRGHGLILDTEDDLENIPRAPDYRAFLPERVDLSGSFPTPGDQGKQNSCVGWSTGYARAYYASKVEGRDLSDLTNIPSSAYIYNSIVEQPRECLSGSKISGGA